MFPPPHATTGPWSRLMIPALLLATITATPATALAADEGAASGSVPDETPATADSTGEGSVSGEGSVPGEEGVLEIHVADGNLGTYLVGPDDMTLYYFTHDVYAGESRCYGTCAAAWPPLLVDAGSEVDAEAGVTGHLGVIPRNDGTQQVAYRGRPLYYHVNDVAPGDTRGQAAGGVWFVALEDGSSPPNPPALTLQTSTTQLGTFLTDGDGRTLYFFAVDEVPGRSECTGACKESWPPLTLGYFTTVAASDDVTGVVGVAPGPDAAIVTYDGRPLYYFAGDTAPGDTNGQGIGDNWYVAAVDGTIPGE